MDRKDVLKRLKTLTTLINTIKIRKTSYLVHVVRHEEYNVAANFWRENLWEKMDRKKREIVNEQYQGMYKERWGETVQHARRLIETIYAKQWPTSLDKALKRRGNMVFLNNKVILIYNSLLRQYLLRSSGLCFINRENNNLFICL